MVVLHTPAFSTPVVFTGTLKSIEEELKDGPTCHGFVTFYVTERIPGAAPGSTKVLRSRTFFPRMFGSGGYGEKYGDSEFRVVIVNTKEGPANSFYLKTVMGRDKFAINAKHLNSHIRHVILAEVTDKQENTRKVEFVGAWRRLPNKPLRELRGRYGNHY